MLQGVRRTLLESLVLQVSHSTIHRRPIIKSATITVVHYNDDDRQLLLLWLGRLLKEHVLSGVAERLIMFYVDVVGAFVPRH